MKYKVTDDQYNHLIRARDNWPENLNGMIFDKDIRDDPGCTLVYLGQMMEQRPYPYNSELRLKNISEYYGIPKVMLCGFIFKNDFFYLFGRKKRARGMLATFNKFLDNVEVISDKVAYENKERSIEEKVGYSIDDEYSEN